METAQSIVTFWFLEGVCIYTDGEQLASCLASKPSGSVMILHAKLIAFTHCLHKNNWLPVYDAIIPTYQAGREK